MRACASGVAMDAPIDRASSESCSAKVRSGCERTSLLACPVGLGRSGEPESGDLLGTRSHLLGLVRGVLTFDRLSDESHSTPRPR